MKRIVVLVMAVAVVAASGCGGNDDPKTCTDACNVMIACATKLGDASAFGTLAECQAECTAAVCTNKQAAIDCLVGVQCTSLEQVGTALAACQAQGGCQL